MEKIKLFIWKYALTILAISLVTGIVSCACIGIFELNTIWYIVPLILGAPILIFFGYLFFIGFLFAIALIKDKIHNKKLKNQNQ